MPLLLELLIATVLVVVTALFHGAGLLVIGRVLRRIDRGANELDPLSWSGALFTTVVVLGLSLLAGLEIWFYGLMYLELGATDTLREAVYFSTITYAAIGFSDQAIAGDWKLLGAIEGINGVLLLGWSVAFLVTELQHIRRR